MQIAQAPASPENFHLGRAGASIDMLVIHVMEGFARGTAAWFANPEAHASAHYGIDVDGRVVQYVDDANEAWHAGNSAVNRRSIGIELEGHSDDPDAFTPAMMGALAELCRELCATYCIPRDREHVIGHNEVPDERHPGQLGGVGHHTDPGAYFPWVSFMAALCAERSIA